MLRLPLAMRRTSTSLTEVRSPLQEQSRAVGNLNPLEKVLFTFSSIILGNRVMRNAFVIYIVTLHGFVFLTIYDS